jgi:hypothetical protein
MHLVGMMMVVGRRRHAGDGKQGAGERHGDELLHFATPMLAF